MPTLSKSNKCDLFTCPSVCLSVSNVEDCATRNGNGHLTALFSLFDMLAERVIYFTSSLSLQLVYLRRC